MIYIDTSALVKLLFEEPESSALTDWLNLKNETPKVSSDLSTVELLRTCRRIDESLLMTLADCWMGSTSCRLIT